MRLLSIITERQYVLRNFIARDLKVKYRGTVLGYLWSLLEPLSLVGIYYFVFEVIWNAREPGYALLVILGILPYNLFGSIVSSSAVALSSNAALIRRVYIPREVFVISSVGSNLIIYGLSLLVVIPFLVVYDVLPGARLALLPVASALLVLFAAGVGFMVACANALYRDIGYVIRVSLRLLFYGSPVIYRLKMVPEDLLDIYLANPLAIYVTLVRESVLNQPSSIPPGYVTYGVVLSLATFWAGSRLFARWESKAVKFL